MTISVGNKRRFVKRSKPWYKRKYNAMEIAGKAWSTAKYLKGIINSELKFKDNTQEGQNISNAGTIALISDLVQGDGAGERNGNSVLVKNIFIRGRVLLDPIAVSSQFRLIILRDTMNTGTAPTVGNILTNAGTGLCCLSPLNKLGSPGRYKILYTKLFTLNNNGTRSQVFKSFIKLDKHIKYTGPDADDEYRNQIYVLMVSNEAVNLPQISYVTRLSYYDN